MLNVILLFSNITDLTVKKFMKIKGIFPFGNQPNEDRHVKTQFQLS
jgi:hypothetical protein